MRKGKKIKKGGVSVTLAVNGDIAKQTKDKMKQGTIGSLFNDPKNYERLPTVIFFWYVQV